MDNNNLNKKIELFLAANKAYIVEDAKRLIRIRSVGQRFDSDSTQPFGPGCGQVLDEAVKLLERERLDVTLFDGYGVKAQLGKHPKCIGFFNHLDVVPEGEGWSFPPYEPFVQDGYLFGRGSLDNKTAAVMALYVLKFFAQSGIGLRHSLYLFLGCNEESGMRDIRYFLSRHEPPQFGLVPDAYFPVCFAEKGMLKADFETEVTDGNLLAFAGGEEYNVIPASASARLSGLDPAEVQKRLSGPFTVTFEGSVTVITAHGKAGHAAFPEGTENASVKLAAALLDYGLVQGAAAVRALRFVKECFESSYGKGLEIEFEDEAGAATSNAGVVKLEGGRLKVLCDIRYGVTQKGDDIRNRLSAAANCYGFQLTYSEDSPPHYIPKDDPVIMELCKLANSELGTDLPPYAMGGITHARWIPRAAAFGPLRMDEESPFPTGKGGGHQPDEAVKLDTIWSAFSIYVKAVLTIDKWI
ncbi:Sapep family Mn(2+)-dependent dipeptidase [Paenibacillus macerans]|uniref:Sapep family Mn(2+)-dependent dipeptidase n=1 Tax=Paenibacillus macerans TaxID=44252 RepID=UPI00203B1C2B|nr:Sapep family Mn(2+)-dependent dipeptidase [Paenibacillus macerans]MCM3698780.1 Sapep family Mn(2+)-dependent dipeptidase [Paenibacillus macerans]